MLCDFNWKLEMDACVGLLETIALNFVKML